MSKKKRDYFMFRREYYESLKCLPYDIKGRLFDAIAEFMLDGIEPNFDGMERFAWDRLYPILLRDLNEME